jgi:hypothetical protein
VPDSCSTATLGPVVVGDPISVTVDIAISTGQSQVFHQVVEVLDTGSINATFDYGGPFR